MSPTLLLAFVIPGNPGDGAVNASRGVSRGQIYKSAKAKSFASRATRAAVVAWSRSAMSSAAIVDCRVDVRSYWPRVRHLEGTSELAMGDVDAPVKAVLDALEAARVVDDDSRVRDLRASKHYDKTNPRIEVEVWTT